MATPITLRQISAPSFKTGAGESLLKQSAADIANAGKLFQDEMARRAEAQYQAEQDALTQQNWQADFDAGRADQKEAIRQFNIEQQAAAARDQLAAQQAGLNMAAKGLDIQNTTLDLQGKMDTIANAKNIREKIRALNTLDPTARQQAIGDLITYSSPLKYDAVLQADLDKLKSEYAQNYQIPGLDPASMAIAGSTITPDQQIAYRDSLRKAVTGFNSNISPTLAGQITDNILDRIPGYRSAEAAGNRAASTSTQQAEAQAAGQVAQTQAEVDWNTNLKTVEPADALYEYFTNNESIVGTAENRQLTPVELKQEVRDIYNNLRNKLKPQLDKITNPADKDKAEDEVALLARKLISKGAGDYDWASRSDIRLDATSLGGENMRDMKKEDLLRELKPFIEKTQYFRTLIKPTK